MDQNDFKKFSKDIVLLAEVHGKTISSAMIGLYFKVLEGHKPDEVNRAMTTAVKTLKFFPKPAELLEIIEAENPRIEDRALLISGRIIAHIRAYGASKILPLDDDPIAKELMIRRWPYHLFASTVTEAELKWWQKEFVEAYRASSESVPQITGTTKLKQIADGIFGG